MKNFLLFCVSMLLCAGHAYSYGGGGGGGGSGSNRPHYRYKITVLNLTKGQPLTPPLVIAHSSKFKVFHLGQQASDGLADLAQDGVTMTLKEELAANKYVYGKAIGSGVIMPGEKQEIVITVKYKPIFSVLSMLARTNDAFIAATVSGGLTKGAYRKSLAQVYDAGVEQNSEDCAHIPAPPCGNHDVGTDGGEGFVRFHEGLHLQRDLNGQRDTFANVAAKIKVERLN